MADKIPSRPQPLIEGHTPPPGPIVRGIPSTTGEKQAGYVPPAPPVIRERPASPAPPPKESK